MMLGKRETGNRKRLVLAVHDVTPAHASKLAQVYSLLAERGLTRYALLVVPDWHGEWPLEQHAGFVDDLLQRQAAGAEIFLHGYRHHEAGFRRTWMQHLGVAGRTAASAEFYLAPPDQAARRLDRGLALFAALGLQPVGFIPPAWLYGPGLADLLRQRNVGLTEGFWAIANLATHRQVFAPALSWSTARPWRSHLTAGIAAVRRVLETAPDLVRVAIHPPDVHVPVVARSLRETLGRLVTRRQVVTYRDALR
ncbi:MAG: polysaccharide deacetylase family protein [Gemmatimonadetes bacterium]|nr:polysaccharide deacetylase family protein [Gemmatimonadota bacterium]